MILVFKILGILILFNDIWQNIKQTDYETSSTKIGLLHCAPINSRNREVDTGRDKRD